MSKKLITHIPNVITCFRIVLSPILLLVAPWSSSFFVIYFICGLSDICDGYLARKWKVSSKYGAAIDSIADFIFIIILLLIFIPILDLKGWMLIWIGIITVIRFLSVIIGACKYHTVAFIHTYGNKVAGFLVICFPILIRAAGLAITVAIICTVAIASAIEELIIMISSDSLDRDKKWK